MSGERLKRREWQNKNRRFPENAHFKKPTQLIDRPRLTTITSLVFPTKTADFPEPVFDKSVKAFYIDVRKLYTARDVCINKYINI